MSPKIIPRISRAISAQDEADGLQAVRFSGVANPQNADYSAAVSSPVLSWVPHGVVAALCAAQSQMLKLLLGERTLRAPPEGDHDAHTTEDY
jgi:hypothetical protein